MVVETPRKSLFDLGHERQSVLDEIDAAGGEIALAQEETLAVLDAAIVAKADAVGWVLQRLESEGRSLADRAKALYTQAKTREALCERIKDRVAAYLVLNGEKQLTGDDFKINLRESESVVVDPMATLPAEYCHKPKAPEPDKTLIKKALKEGVVLSGVSLVKRNFVVVR